MATEAEMRNKRVAVVTGGNRGLGLAVVEALAEDPGMVVVLAARDAAAGARALAQLKKPNVVVQQLDVQDPSSIARFAAWLQSEIGGLDILINNAGVNAVVIDQEAFVKYKIQPGQVLIDKDARDKVLINNYEISKNCIETNYYGAKRISEALLPLFKASPSGAHIINVSSSLGQLKYLPNESLRENLSNMESLTEDLLDKIIEDYLKDHREEKLEEKKWPIHFSAYVMSKICLNAYTRVLAKEFENRLDDHKIYVNVVHPGWVVTDMSWGTGELTPHEASQALVWVALHKHNPPPSGKFLYRKKPFDFVG